MQFVENRPWIPAFNIHYNLGVDGISVLFILLTSFTTVLVVIAGWKVIEKKVAQYMAAFLIMLVMNGVFASSTRSCLRVLGVMLLDVFIAIGVWGGPNRVYAALKFFLYTLTGSPPTLIALIYLFYQAHGSFSILDFQHLPLLPMDAQTDLHCLLYRVRGQSADVAGAYLVAGRARGSAHRWFRGAGGDHAQGRRERLRRRNPAMGPAL